MYFLTYAVYLHHNYEQLLVENDGWKCKWHKTHVIGKLAVMITKIIAKQEFGRQLNDWQLQQHVQRLDAKHKSKKEGQFHIVGNITGERVNEITLWPNIMQVMIYL